MNCSGGDRIDQVSVLFSAFALLFAWSYILMLQVPSEPRRPVVHTVQALRRRSLRGVTREALTAGVGLRR